MKLSFTEKGNTLGEADQWREVKGLARHMLSLRCLSDSRECNEYDSEVRCRRLGRRYSFGSLIYAKIFLIARSVLVNICIQHRSRALYIITVGRKTTIKFKNQASV